MSRNVAFMFVAACLAIVSLFYLRRPYPETQAATQTLVIEREIKTKVAPPAIWPTRDEPPLLPHYERLFSPENDPPRRYYPLPLGPAQPPGPCSCPDLTPRPPMPTPAAQRAMRKR